LPQVENKENDDKWKPNKKGIYNFNLNFFG
jgi:hypothetical protein